MTKIKYCGITQMQDIDTINKLEIDYVGFIFVKSSKRYIEPEMARILKQSLIPTIKTVGVFVNEEIDVVKELFKQNIIDTIQLHGDEDDSYINLLKKDNDFTIIKAFRIDTKNDINKANNSSADMVLLDNGNGGTGKSFDWSLLKQMNRPYILAGGLTLENIDYVTKNIHPYGVDISSGIETNGYKDREKMIAFASRIREEY